MLFQRQRQTFGLTDQWFCLEGEEETQPEKNTLSEVRHGDGLVMFLGCFASLQQKKQCCSEGKGQSRWEVQCPLWKESRERNRHRSGELGPNLL